MDERFIYLHDNLVIRMGEIKALVWQDDKINVFIGPGEDDCFEFYAIDFNKVFGTDYSQENINKHLLELFLNELNEGIVNRPKYKAVKPVLVQKADNSIVRECPVCGKPTSSKDYHGGIHSCGGCGVMLDYDAIA